MEIFLILVVAIVAYLLVTKRSRRDSAVEGRLLRMLDANQPHATFNDLYFEAAQSYAASKGGKSFDAQSVSAKTVLNNVVYQIHFSKSFQGGTSVSIEEYDQAHKRMRDIVMGSVERSKVK